MMKTIFILFFIAAAALIFAQNTDTETELFQKYIRYKERFYRNFIRIDWGGNGIGAYKENKLPLKLDIMIKPVSAFLPLVITLQETDIFGQQIQTRLLKSLYVI